MFLNFLHFPQQMRVSAKYILLLQFNLIRNT